MDKTGFTVLVVISSYYIMSKISLDMCLHVHVYDLRWYVAVIMHWNYIADVSHLNGTYAYMKIKVES